MDVQNLLTQLREERDRIEEAISALQGLNHTGGKVAAKSGRGRRHMSSEARARISRAMKLRWAQRKKRAA